MLAGTHGGLFQTDDLLTYLTLRKLFPGLRLIRTFERALLDKADLLFDIGGIYSHRKRRYDHHQREGLEERKRPNGVPYSALGLVWRHYGKRFCQSFAAEHGVGNTLLAQRLDQMLIQPIDADDCGVTRGGLTLTGRQQTKLSMVTLPSIVAALNPAPILQDTGSAATDKAFFTAADVVWPIFRSIVVWEAAKLRAAAVVRSAYQDGQHVLVLPVPCAWEDVVIADYPDIRFVVYPLLDKDETWVVEGVHQTPGGKALRRKLPKSWAGLAGAELQSLTGVPDVRRASAARYRCLVSSRSGAEAIAKLALRR